MWCLFWPIRSLPTKFQQWAGLTAGEAHVAERGCVSMILHTNLNLNLQVLRNIYHLKMVKIEKTTPSHSKIPNNSFCQVCSLWLLLESCGRCIFLKSCFGQVTLCQSFCKVESYSLQFYIAHVQQLNCNSKFQFW